MFNGIENKYGIIKFEKNKLFLLLKRTRKPKNFLNTNYVNFSEKI